MPVMRSKHFLIVLVLLTLSSGCFHSPAEPSVSAEYYELFAMIWDNFEANYPEFTHKNLDWKAVFVEYSPVAEQVQTTEELVYDVLVPMLAELQDAHVWLRDPEGEKVRPWLPEINLNFDMDVLAENYLGPAGYTQHTDAVGFCDPEILPYLQISSWITEATDIAMIETFVEMAADEPAIIIDIRMNTGGSSIHCNEVAGMFTNVSVLAGYWRYRTGPGYDDVRNERDYTTPNGNFNYPGTVYLLIGDYSASAAEFFTLNMMNLENVVMLGDTTMGAVCAPRQVNLTDGWTVSTIILAARDADKQPVEGVGIAPDIFVDAGEDDFAQGADPVLDYAIDLVNSQTR